MQSKSQKRKEVLEMQLNTPIEKYNVDGKSVYVKRDDLMGDGSVLPPWGKLSALKNLLLDIKPTRPFIHLSVYGSWSGWALSKISKELGYEEDEMHKVIKEKYQISSTRKLSKPEFTELIEQIKRWAVIDMGIVLPNARQPHQ